MQEGISTRARIAILIYSMTNAVLFGIGIILVLKYHRSPLTLGSASLWWSCSVWCSPSLSHGGSPRVSGLAGGGDAPLLTGCRLLSLQPAPVDTLRAEQISLFGSSQFHFMAL